MGLSSSDPREPPIVTPAVEGGLVGGIGIGHAVLHYVRSPLDVSRGQPWFSGERVCLDFLLGQLSELDHWLSCGVMLVELTTLDFALAAVEVCPGCPCLLGVGAFLVLCVVDRIHDLSDDFAALRFSVFG